MADENGSVATIEPKTVTGTSPDSTAASPASLAAADPANPAGQSAAATDKSEPAPGAEPKGASAETVSDDEIAFGKMLLGQPEQAVEQTEDETESEPAPARGAGKGDVVVAGSPDDAELTKILTAEFGDSAKPAVERLVSRFAHQDQTIASLTEQLQEALGAIKELGGKVEPLSGWVQGEQTRAQVAEAGEVHKWFDGRAGFGDRYGATKSNPDTDHNPMQQMARKTIYGTAIRMIQSAKQSGQRLALPKALAMAEAITFGQPTKAGAVEAVRGEVKQAARGLSVDPARGGRSSGPMTAEQEHDSNVKTVRDILARSRSGDRK